MPPTIEAPAASPQADTGIQAPANDSSGPAFDDYFSGSESAPDPSIKPDGKQEPKAEGNETAQQKEGPKPDLAADKAKTPQDKSKSEEAAKDSKDGEAKAADPDKPVRKTPWQLVHEYEAEISKLRKQVKGEGDKPIDDHPRVKELSIRVEAAEKARKDMEDRIRYVDYSASPEYKEKYEAPFVNAYMAGRSKVASMTVLTEDGNGSRKGTAEDFDRVMAANNDDEAATLADQMFGAKSSLVLYHRERTMEMNAARNTALEEYRTKGSEFQKQAKEQQAKFQKDTSEQIGQFWKKHVEGPREKYAAYAKPIEGDEAGNKLLERGYERAQQAFSNLNPFDPKLSPEQRENLVRLHGMVLNKAAWFDRVVHQKQAIEAELKEAKAKLEAIEKSSPKGGLVHRSKEKAQATWEEQMNSLAR